MTPVKSDFGKHASPEARLIRFRVDVRKFGRFRFNGTLTRDLFVSIRNEIKYQREKNRFVRG